MVPGAEPVFLPGGPTGVLLLHGFTSSPAEVRPLADYLAAQGYTVASPLLAGHGTSPDDLRGTTWQDWVDSAEAGLPLLPGGGLHPRGPGWAVAGRHDQPLPGRPPAHRLPGRRDDELARLPAAHLRAGPALAWHGAAPLLRQRDQRRVENGPARHALTYTRTPLESVSALVGFLNEVNLRLPQITTPTLVIYSRQDRLVLPFNAMRIYGAIPTPDKHLMVLHRARHVVTIGAEAPRVFAAIHSFLQREEARPLDNPPPDPVDSPCMVVASAPASL